MSGLIGIPILAVLIAVLIALLASTSEELRNKCPSCRRSSLKKSGETRRFGKIFSGTIEEEWRCPRCGYSVWGNVTAGNSTAWSGGSYGGDVGDGGGDG